MGGHALSVSTVRLNAVDYHNLVGAISGVITSKFPALKFAVIPAYFQKPDFGDMDILFSSEGFDPLEVVKELQATEGVRNGDVTSIGVSVDTGIFQIDLISTPKECFDFSLNYFSFNDLGNLAGRCFHNLGFKFGHNGLLYVLRDPEKPTQVLEELTVTTSFEEALHIGGYFFEEYEKGRLGGFQTLEDIFKYIVSTPYFNKDIYLLDNRNAKARVRDAKRKTYMSFLDWIADKDLPAFDYSKKEELRKKALEYALDIFPDFESNYIAALEKNIVAKEVAKKFNGTLVAKLTGLTGKELGMFIQAFKHSCDDFENFVLSSTDLECSIKNFKAYDYLR